MVKIGDYLIYQNRNRIIINLPQTAESLENTTQPISKSRKVTATPTDLEIILLSAIHAMERKNYDKR